MAALISVCSAGDHFVYAGGSRRERRATVVELITHNSENIKWHDRYNQTSTKELRVKVELDQHRAELERLRTWPRCSKLKCRPSKIPAVPSNMSFIHDRVGGAPKAIELIPGNQPRVAIAATKKAERPSDRRGRSQQAPGPAADRPRSGKYQLIGKTQSSLPIYLLSIIYYIATMRSKGEHRPMKRTAGLRCTICNHPARPQIDLAIATGLSKRAVAAPLGSRGMPYRKSHVAAAPICGRDRGPRR